MVRKNLRAALYLRTSKSDQTTENQRLALEEEAGRRGWTVTETYRDHGISGAKFGKLRPELDRMLKDAKRHRFDVVMAWSIDRVGRSTHEVTGIMEELETVGVSQFYLQQGIDGSTPAGRAMIQMAIVFSEFERGIIRERIMAGLERAKRVGTKSGKAIGRPKTSANVEGAIRAKLQQGAGALRTAKELGVGVSVVMRVKRAAEAA
jgi:DNA invertase Pin-like site-specific DNA recombinase